MKAIEFSTKLSDNNRIEIPDYFADELVKNGSVRVIVLIDERKTGNDEEKWDNLATEQFLKGYAASDSIYDNYL